MANFVIPHVLDLDIMSKCGSLFSFIWIMQLQIAVCYRFTWCQLESLPLIWFIEALDDRDCNHLCKQGHSSADVWKIVDFIFMVGLAAALLKLSSVCVSLPCPPS